MGKLTNYCNTRERTGYTVKMTVVFTTKGAYLVANETVEMLVHPPNSDL